MDFIIVFVTYYLTLVAVARHINIERVKTDIVSTLNYYKKKELFAAGTSV